MRKLTHLFALMAALASFSSTAGAAEPPAPVYPVPTDAQVNWLRMEWYGFVHFGLNTYSNREWGYGNEDPKLFNPTKFDAEKIARTFKEAGMSGMIYTAKHHDGWCAWPTGTTSYSVAASPWKDGKGDVVQEFADACKKVGIAFGIYVSPWDRSCSDYGMPSYLRTYYGQVEELLTKYGPVFELWFDGANGGDGYYGGAYENRDIGSAEVYYDYPALVRMIRSLQPNCIVWGAEDNGDVRWGGSEQGYVPYPCRNVRRKHGREVWISLEGDTTINARGWFWHPGQSSSVKTADALMRIFMDSVGRGANLILNVAPNRDGELDPADVASLNEFAQMRRQLLSRDYALGAKAEASQVRGNDPRFGADKLTDGDIETYWCPEDGTRQAWVVLTLPKPVTFDVVRLREQIRLGQRVNNFEIDAFINGNWQTVNHGGKSIGNQVMWWSKQPITTDRVRVRITASRGCPCLNEISLLRMPTRLPLPKIERHGHQLSISSEDAGLPIVYTLDGSEPTENSTVYEAGKVTLPHAGTVKAACLAPNGGIGPVRTVEFGLCKNGWTSATASAAIDDDATTIWQEDKVPATFVVDMGSAQTLSGFSVLPRQDGKHEGIVTRYIFSLSEDGKNWKIVSRGEYSNLRANPIEQRMEFPATKARYFRFNSRKALQGQCSSVAEINVFPADQQGKEKK